VPASHGRPAIASSQATQEPGAGGDAATVGGRGACVFLQGASCPHLRAHRRHALVLRLDPARVDALARLRAKGEVRCKMCGWFG